MQGTDGSVWLYRAVPLAPVADAPDEVTGLEPGGPILTALDELAAMTGTRIARRSAAKSGYRQVHLLLVNVPRRFTPDPRSAGAAHLAEMFPDTRVQRRLLLFGVRLRDRITGSGWRSAVDSAVETLISGTVPLSDFDADHADVDQALTRAGLIHPHRRRLPVGRRLVERRPVRRHPDPAARRPPARVHLGVRRARRRPGRPGGLHGLAGVPRPARRHVRRGGTVRPRRHPGHHAAGPAGRRPWSPRGALAVSVRGLVEPAKITRARTAAPPPVVPAGRHRAVPGREDVRRPAGGDPGRTRGNRERVRAGRAAALVDSTVLAALNGRFDDVAEVARDSAVTLNAMPYRQEAAFAETWLCSPVRAVPHLHDLPSHTVAYSGLPSLSTVGDPDGALLGFTEKDRQPAYLSPTAASSNDGMPIAAVFGQPEVREDHCRCCSSPTSSREPAGRR